MSDATPIDVTVNGEHHHVEADPRLLLVDLVRDVLGLKGTHIGCLTGDCGSCTMMVDGEIVKSCLELGVGADGASIRTIEGLAADGTLSPIQQAFWDEYGFQCGYCLPGMLFAAEDLLRRVPDPTEEEIRHAIDGNLCRCTGYHGIVRAIKAAAAQRGAASGDSSATVAAAHTPGLGTGQASARGSGEATSPSG